MVERDELGVYHEVTERDRKYHNEARTTLLCRIFGHKFFKMSIGAEKLWWGTNCYRCGFDYEI